MMNLKAGDKAPYFEAQDEQGNTVKLTDYKGKKLVLFFYPKASTPGCTAEACDLNDNFNVLQQAGYSILGVSTDSVTRQQKFKEKYGFKYPLLADTEHVVINAYGVWGLKKFMGREYDGIHRTTFLINENGEIERVIEKVKTKEHANQILNA